MGPDWSRICVKGLGRFALSYHTAHLIDEYTRRRRAPACNPPLLLASFPHFAWCSFIPQEQPDGELGVESIL